MSLKDNEEHRHTNRGKQSPSFFVLSQSKGQVSLVCGPLMFILLLDVDWELQWGSV